MERERRQRTDGVREQAIRLALQTADAPPWRRVEIALTAPTESGDTQVVPWTNLPATVSAIVIAQPYRKRWCIEGMFQHLESVLNSGIKSLGHPRAAPLGFATAVLACNVLVLLKRVIEQAHPASHPPWDVSPFHLMVAITSGYEAIALALPAVHTPCAGRLSPPQLMQRLLTLARRLNPKSLASGIRKPKPKRPKGYVDGAVARAHVATARVLKSGWGTP